MHLSNVASFVWFGFLGRLDVAVVEVAGILPDGRLIPSSSVGNSKTWLDQADKIIPEINSLQNADLEGMHDIYYDTRLAPHLQPITLTVPGDRIGEACLTCDLSKIIAMVPVTGLSGFLHLVCVAFFGFGAVFTCVFSY